MPRPRKAAPFRRVVISIWNDPDVKPLPLEDKAVLFYLFTNEHSHPCGLYRLPPAYLMDELGLDRQRWEVLIDGPLAPFATYDWATNEIFVHSMGRHQIGQKLVGGDKRIPWVMTQLTLIHSVQLVRAFEVKYADWALDFGGLKPQTPDPDQMDLETGQDPHNEAKREGAWEGASPTSLKATESDESGKSRKASPDAKREGAWEARPSIQTQRAVKPPVQSSARAGQSEAVQDGQQPEGEGRDEHPDLARIWPAVERALYAPWWHGGNGPVILEGGKSITFGLERWITNDLIWITGDADVVRFAIEIAHRVFDWDGSERHSLYWLKQGENLIRCEGEFHKYQPADAAGVKARKIPPPTDEPGERRAELHRQLEQARRADATTLEEPHDPLTPRGSI